MSRSQVLLIGLMTVLLAATNVSQSHASLIGNQLTDPGFDLPLSTPFISYVNVVASPFTQDRWGDENSTAVGPSLGVVPQAGNGMLRMDDDGLTVTQIWQRVDVTACATGIDAGSATADLSGWFNVPAGFTGAVSAVNIEFFDASNVSTGPGVTATSAAIGGIDADPTTWQFLPLSNVAVPALTRTLQAQFLYVNSSIPPNTPGFVDSPSLQIFVPEPATCQLWATALALAAASVMRRRRN